MSLTVTKAGLLDAVQDGGRHGYRHLGIGPSGAMDQWSAALANALLGKELTAPVIEMHFPAAQFRFNKACVVCLAGADFSPAVDGMPVALHQPFLVNTGAELKFGRRKSGARCYLVLVNEMRLTPWLKSYSTQLKVAAGGFEGRPLRKGDEISVGTLPLQRMAGTTVPLPWKYNGSPSADETISVMPGPEWDWLTPESGRKFSEGLFTVSPSSDRMGYRLEGPPLQQQNASSLVSSPVTFGTVQLLPNGQLIVLMADHQTTGGYPRIANVVSTDLPKLAQMNSGDAFRFTLTDVASAEALAVQQCEHVFRLQQHCAQKMKTWLHAHRP